MKLPPVRDGADAMLVALATQLSALPEDDTAAFGTLCETLVAAGLPLWRVAMQLENLHPLHYGYCLHWTEGQPGQRLERSFEFGASPEFAASPYMAALHGDGWGAWKLDRDDLAALPLLRDLREAGASEYVSDIVSPHGALPPGISWTTRRSGGFTEAEHETLRRVGRIVAPFFALAAERRTTETVLRTYLGRGPAEAVRAGAVRRGDVREVEALILLTDLRGFTAFAAANGDAAVLDRLGRYCEAVTDAVTEAGGDVLKFVGDGIVSIFTLENGLARTVPAALDAVATARDCALDFVAVLHAGRVAYGNVGARTRLDFTVIGDAVNLASRLERVAKEEGVPTVLTETVAAHAPSAESLGTFTIRGVADPVPLFRAP